MDELKQIVVKVALPVPMDQVYDYFPPVCLQDGSLKLQSGVRVMVPFGSRKVIGLIVDVKQYVSSSIFDPQTVGYVIKPIIKILDAEPLWSESLWKALSWSAQYYCYPLGEVLHFALPKDLREGGESQLIEALYYSDLKFSDELSHLLKKAPKQLEALEQVIRHPMGISWHALQGLGFKKTVLMALEKKGLIRLKIFKRWQEPIGEPAFSAVTPSLLQEPSLSLNQEQNDALEAIKTCGGYQCFLLEGVTGSGKTEVYLQAIEHCLTQGRQALVLVPEIGLTHQTIERLKRRFTVPIGVYHSRLTDNEKKTTWIQARNGYARILIGTRSAIFLPLKTPGMLIIDEEHDASYKQQEGFRYHARDLGLYRARLEQIPVVLGSATPALESIYNTRKDRYSHLTLYSRPAGGQLPKLTVLDVREQRLKAGLSEQTLAAIKMTLAAQQQAIVFLNRRGYAPVLMCHACGYAYRCEHCDVYLTVHKQKNCLICHHCEHLQVLPTQCAGCQSPKLQFIGFGTQKIEAQLSSLFAEVPVLRIDRDTTGSKYALEAYRRQIECGDPMILVGTQMLSKGHHFPKVTLSVIVDADCGLVSVDFRGTEKLAQLITQVAGRSGRGEAAGAVIIQTRQPQHPMLRLLTEHNYAVFADQALDERKETTWPPYSFLALIRAKASDPALPQAFLQTLRVRLQERLLQVKIMGPVSAPLVKRAGQHRYQLLLQADKRSLLHKALNQVSKEIMLAKPGHKLRVSIDVDPVDLY